MIDAGVQAKGMPAFDLPPQELDAVVAYIQSIGAPAAGQDVPGDLASGERLFFGKAGCSSCHMAGGRGRAVGPICRG